MDPAYCLRMQCPESTTMLAAVVFVAPTQQADLVHTLPTSLLVIYPGELLVEAAFAVAVVAAAEVEEVVQPAAVVFVQEERVASAY